MIETEYYILNPEDYHEIAHDANAEGVTIDYFLMEFCDVETVDS